MPCPGDRPIVQDWSASKRSGAAIDIEVWSLPTAAFGSFVAGIPAPLAIGKLTLADGREVSGFLCEAHATSGAQDITGFGGWRAYQDSRR
jgi:allophanate hydrolase